MQQSASDWFCFCLLELQATIMTDPGMADRTYITPMTPELVEQILAKVRCCATCKEWMHACRIVSTLQQSRVSCRKHTACCWIERMVLPMDQRT